MKYLIVLLLVLAGCAGHNPPPDGTMFTQEIMALTNGQGMTYPLTVTELTYKGNYYYSVNPVDPVLWVTAEGVWVEDVFGLELAEELSYAFKFVQTSGEVVPPPTRTLEPLPEKF